MLSNNILTDNFFELFEVPLVYDVNLAQVQQRYMDLQSQVHPDKFASANDAEKRLSMQMTSRINEAMQTLKDPVQRASYLLNLKGLDINLENETTMDAGFLMQQLELREAMAEIKKYSEAEDSLDKLDTMSQQINKQIKIIMANFSAAFESAQLDDAREWLRKLQFLQKAKQEVENLSAEIEDGLMA